MNTVNVVIPKTGEIIKVPQKRSSTLAHEIFFNAYGYETGIIATDRGWEPYRVRRTHE